MINVLTADEPLGLQANLTSDERIEVSPHYPPCMMSCTAPAGATDTASDCAEVQRAFPPCTSAFRSGLRRLQRAERGSVGVLWVVMEGSPGGRAAAGAASSARQRTAPLRLHMAPSITTGCCWLVLAASRHSPTLGISCCIVCWLVRCRSARWREPVGSPTRR